MTKIAKYKTISWQHLEVKLRDREDELISEEFFNDVDTLSEISSLVRESMQNSIDEILDKNEPIKIRFKVGKQNSELNKEYFSDIYQHAQLSIQKSLLPSLDDESFFLVIEDFNTNGLRGSLSSKKPTASSSEKYHDNYWYFEWKSGETNKLTGGRGSWGVGKIVLSAASRLKTILVYSERQPHSCPEPNTDGILFGHSIFRYATLENNKRLRPYRNWMKEIKVGDDIDYIPTSDVDDINKFRHDWQIDRAPKNYGTSIVIPFVKSTITAMRLIQCIIQDYFIAILDGHVICEVVDENNKKFELNKENLVSLIEDLDEDSWTSATKNKQELIGFCQMYEKRIKNKTFKMEIRQQADSANDWTNWEFKENVKEEFRSKIEEGLCVEFEVITEVPTHQAGFSHTDRFSVLFSKHNSEGMSKTLFTRQGIIIPEAFRESKLNGLLSMVIIEENDGNYLQQMLRLSEGPAHKNWTATGDKVLGRYEIRGLKKTIQWVKNSALSIFKKLQPDQNTADDRSLAKYFPDEEANDNLSGTTDGDGESGVGKPLGGHGGSGGVGAPRGGRLVKIEAGLIPGSIKIMPLDVSRIETGMLFEIEIAYALRGGDSFSAWDYEDFDLNKLLEANKTKGVRTSFVDNKAYMEVLNKDFELVFANFDENRDISIEVKKVK
jgi:hypothetical protein